MNVGTSGTKGADATHHTYVDLHSVPGVLAVLAVQQVRLSFETNNESDKEGGLDVRFTCVFVEEHTHRVWLVLRIASLVAPKCALTHMSCTPLINKL